MFSSGLNALSITGSTPALTIEQLQQKEQQFVQGSAAAAVVAGDSGGGAVLDQDPLLPTSTSSLARGGGVPLLSGGGGSGRGGMSGASPYTQRGAYPYSYPYPYPNPYPYLHDWTARELGTTLESDMLTVTFGYCFVGFSNVLFQGLLNMHALLDNPFGEEEDGNHGHLLVYA